ncbi:hypothetical protein Ocin01_18542 [Orchesella cincta]|uniref:DUF4806 domain-containing protein n=1 Tax=Orchesella cincta TaxID=48709 RepID=A0A1D2M5F9_ORCCI|nr:hypothetical protein Ocin01_18542 [Orchesella cincta]
MTATHTSPSVGLGSSGPNNEQNADSTVVDLLKKLVLDSGDGWRKLETCVEHRVQASGQSCVDSCLIPHPFSTVADFQAFDTVLDDDKKEVLKCELLRCGGDTTVEFIGRVMKKLMTNEVGLKYSLWGFRNNINFSKTAAWEVVKDSALSFKRINSTEKAIEKSVSEWFRHSGDRIKQQNTNLIKPSGSTSTTNSTNFRPFLTNSSKCIEKLIVTAYKMDIVRHRNDIGMFTRLGQQHVQWMSNGLSIRASTGPKNAK